MARGGGGALSLHASGPALMARGSCGAKAPLPPRAEPKSQFECVPRDTEKPEFLDLVGFGGAATSVESVTQIKHFTHRPRMEKSHSDQPRSDGM